LVDLLFIAEILANTLVHMNIKHNAVDIKGLGFTTSDAKVPVCRR
jgi:hypothetical protein